MKAINNMFLAAIACSLATLGGCLTHPVARSTYLITPTSADASRSHAKHAADRIVAAVAEANNMQLFESRNDKDGELAARSYIYLVFGPNHTLHMEIAFEEFPFRINTAEEYVSRPTSKHRQLVRDLKSRLQAAGLQVKKVDE